MWQPYLTLAMMYAAHGQPQEVVDTVFRALESLGYVVEGGRFPHTPGTPLLVKRWGLMQHGFVGCWMSLAIAFRRLGLDIEAQGVTYARITYRIWVGEEKHLVKPTVRSQRDQRSFLPGRNRDVSCCGDIAFLRNIIDVSWAVYVRKEKHGLMRHLC